MSKTFERRLTRLEEMNQRPIGFRCAFIEADNDQEVKRLQDDFLKNHGLPRAFFIVEG